MKLALTKHRPQDLISVAPSSTDGVKHRPVTIINKSVNHMINKNELDFVCYICCKTVATKSDNTTNMHLHLKHNHQTTTKATEGPSLSSRQSTITGAFSQQTKDKQDSAKWWKAGILINASNIHSQYKLLRRTRERWHTKGSGLLFLVVCNLSAIFAKRNWESFLFIVSGC